MPVVETAPTLFKDILLILISITASAGITYCMTSSFRNKDKKDTQFFRDRDKEGNDARNLRSELREYFLINCKPIIDEFLKDYEQIIRKYVHLMNKDDSSISVYELRKDFDDYQTLIFRLPLVYKPLLLFVKNLSHKEYGNRFNNYFYIINHIQKLYTKFISLRIVNIHSSQILNWEEKEKQLLNMTHIIFQLNHFLAQSELILFNYKFDKDAFIFQKHIDILDKVVLETGLDNAKDFLFNREELEKILESLEMK